MGLSLAVGYLADMQNDAEGAAWSRGAFNQVNSYLVSIGLPEHGEPEQCDIFSCDMYGYSGLHYLRRIAAHLDISGQLPAPGDENASEDPVLQKYYKPVESKPVGFFNRLFQRSSATQLRTFDHLIIHSDAEGYYLPQDFPSVLFPPANLKIAGGMIGSSVRLLDECTRLTQALEVPLNLDYEAYALWHACDSQGTGDTKWQRYGIESFTCLRLHAAAQHSIKTGAAIVFC